LEHKITRLQFQSLAPKSRFAVIEYPYYTLEKYGIYGLEKSIDEAIERIMYGIVPKEKKSIFSKISASSKKFSIFFRNHPITFGLLLILLNQGVSELLEEQPVIDVPPGPPL